MRPQAVARKTGTWSLFLLLLFAWAGCGVQRPVLYPNDHLRRVGAQVSEKDVEECMRRAEEYVSSTAREADVAESAAMGAGSGAAIGAAGGAVGGAVTGQAGRGAAVGAAGGGAAGFAGGLLGGLSKSAQPGPVYKSFVDRCLRGKGYDPIGWR